jgi:uncharacterized protein (TIGR02680 family)
VVARRWVLSRAGILNVYQYGDETLHFHGGRLLLRGVNGSGKSTAMNMLLPFLLDTDTRRIDAAGEQSGVLRSWMLSGRDEQQPVGYLWLELRRGDAYTTIGCGIRANRSTDRVTTWWYLTDRRPGIDLTLVENRVPLSPDALRVELGSHAVFAQDQRAAYRHAVRDRLFGGADIDQHIRLLHILRSPRVGDRIDVDLPQYLEEALPQLSDAALDDAAQPLEDLDEHRRSVEDLTKTGSALGALATVYRNYGRAELHRRALHVQELADQVAGCRRAEASAARAHSQAIEAREAADRALSNLDQDIWRLAQEIDGLKQSDAYKAGVELKDVRAHVATLARQLAAAEAELDKGERRLAAARTKTERAQSQVGDDLALLRDRLSDLAGLAVRAGLTCRPPGPPSVEVTASPVAGVEVPAAPVAPEPLRAALGSVRADVLAREGDVVAVRAALGAVEEAERQLQLAERAVRRAAGAEQDAGEAFAGSRARLGAAVQSWRGELADWIGRFDAHRSVDGLAGTDPALVQRPDLVDVRAETLDHLRVLLDETGQHHQSIAARLAARGADEQATVDELATQLAELLARSLPSPPATAWQRSDRGPCLAEVVDFHADLAPEARAGLEAALEAAGLLGAELRPGGMLDLGDGELVVLPGPAAGRRLDTLLHPAIGDEHRGRVDDAAVAAVLASISTDPADLGRGAADDGAEPTLMVATVDGRFRVGTLQGRHEKPEAEHVGLGARRAALERRRAEVAAALEGAEVVVRLTGDELALRLARRQEIDDLRRQLPRTKPVDDAVIAATLAEGKLAEARADLERRQGECTDADRDHGMAIEAAERTAADRGLPANEEGLDGITRLLLTAQRDCGQVENDLKVLGRGIQGWKDHGERCDEAATDVGSSRAAVDGLGAEHETHAARLATLEDSVGLPYQEVVAALELCEREHADATLARPAADEARLAAHRDVEAKAGLRARAAAATADAEGVCRSALPVLQRVLEVPGLLAAVMASGPLPEPVEADRAEDADEADEAGGSDGRAGRDDLAFPVVATTSDGARELAAEILRRVPTPTDPAAGADSVRLSLRQRRDALGAGWDAEDRQPDETLPLHVEVTGPLGRMPLAESVVRTEAQRRTMAGLLSAKQDQALRNLLQGLVAREVAVKLHAAGELVELMNRRLAAVRTSHGIGVSLRWRRRDDLDATHADMVALLAKTPDLRPVEEDRRLSGMVADRIAQARADDPEAGYRDLIARVLDYRRWYRMGLVLHRPGRPDERLKRGTALSEGEKKMVSYLPLFAAVAASCDALAEHEPEAPRFVLLDDAFAKVSEDNHAKLFGLLVEMELDFVATSERLWGTHETVPELAITEVLRDATLGVIVLEHSRWDGRERTVAGVG